MLKATKSNELIQAMSEAVEYMRGQKEGSITYQVKVPDKIVVTMPKTQVLRVGTHTA